MRGIVKNHIQPLIIILLLGMVLVLMFQNQLKAVFFPNKETRQDMLIKRMSKSGQTIRLVDVGSLAEGPWTMFCIMGPGVNPAQTLPREASLSNQRLQFNALDRMTKEHEMTFVQIDPQGWPSMHVRPHNMNIVLPASHKCVLRGKPTTFLPVGSKDFTFYR